jgi:signal transduction histidine kinase
MQFTRPSGLTVVTAALLVLLPALAILQYRWVGQVSEAERERMQHNLRNAASQFRDAFELEVGRAVLGLQVGPFTARDGSSEQYTDRYETWFDTAEHPQLVSNIYLVDADRAQLRLRRFDRPSHAFHQVAWPAELDMLRPEFERQRRDFAMGVAIDRRGAFVDDESLIISPLRNLIGPGGAGGQPTSITPVFGFTVLQLDVRYMQEEILPALAGRFFIHEEGDSYRVAVVSVTAPSRVLYKSDDSAPVDASQADATEIIFGVRGGGGGRFFLGRGNGGMRLGPGQGPNDERRLPPTEPRQPRDEERGRWRLLVRHASGSLETAVASVRWRNLGLSFGMLLLLTVSVALLMSASRRAHRLAEQQMEFVAGVTHELRTPVAVIRSAAENLSHGVVGNSDKVKRYGAMIESEARRLGEMIESVLQYAGLASGAGLGGAAPVAPAEIIDAAIDTAIATAGGAGSVTVQRDIAPDLPSVIGDAPALRSAMQNLLANAVKYGGADRWVGVRAEHAGGRHPEIRITVSDHGAGIPPADLPHIFEPFYRGSDAVAGQVHGNGLGLSLVRRIAIAHGGSVAVSSKPNAGTTFTLTLPAAPPQSRASAVADTAGVTAHTAHT